MNYQNFGFNNQNNSFNLPFNNIQHNFLDLITQQVTNNIISYINNSNNQINTKSIIKNNNNNEDTKGKLSSKIKKEKNAFSLGQKNNNKDKIIIQNCSYNYSLIKRKENLNKFIFNYRFKHTNLANKNDITRKKEVKNIHKELNVNEDEINFN